MTTTITRTLSNTILKDSSTFKIVLLTGPRQVGKTTLLQTIEATSRSYVTLDDLSMRTAAIQDPAGFISKLTLPVLIDEVQYAPELFPYIKMTVDKAKMPGLFWLTGSQQFDMMKNVTESLAGRVTILKLQGISLAEEQGRSDDPPFLTEPTVLQARKKRASPLSINAIYHKIWRGSYPDVVLTDGDNWERFYESYVSTYIQRDVQDYLHIRDTTIFLKFLQIAAARSGQLLNYADISRDVGISEVTVKAWLGVLEASGIITLLQPYFKNRTTRLIKTPKLYFMDTGLCSFLTGWLNPEVLERGAMSGAMLETYVVSEIIKSYYHNGRNPRIYFYRDKNKKEIDIILEENGKIYPIEIKKTASPNKKDAKAFDVLNNLKLPIGHGAVVCFVSDHIPLAENIDAIPLWYI